MSSALVAIDFNYDILPPDLAEDARTIANRIKRRLKDGYLDTGRDLNEMKDRLGHGRFGAWLAAEFGMTARTAERYMAAARFDASNSDIVSELLPATIYALAAPSLPDEVRITCITRIKAGGVIRPKDVATLASETRYAAREQAMRAKALPKGKAAREAALAAEAVRAAAAERREATAIAARAELVALITEALGDAGCHALVLLNKTLNYCINNALKEALQAEVAQ